MTRVISRSPDTSTRAPSAGVGVTDAAWSRGQRDEQRSTRSTRAARSVCPTTCSSFETRAATRCFSVMQRPLTGAGATTQHRLKLRYAESFQRVPLGPPRFSFNNFTFRSPDSKLKFCSHSRGVFKSLGRSVWLSEFVQFQTVKPRVGLHYRTCVLPGYDTESATGR